MGMTVKDRYLIIILTTPDDIIDVWKIININKASCIDNISSEILRDVF